MADLKLATSVKQGSEVARAWVEMGRLALDTGDFQTALGAYGKALEFLKSNEHVGGVTKPLTEKERNTLDREARVEIARIILERELEISEIPGLLEPKRASDPKDAEALLLLGRAYFSLKKEALAITALKAVSPRSPQFHEADKLLRELQE